MKMSRDKDRKRKEPPDIDVSRDIYQKRKEPRDMDMSMTNIKTGKNLLLWKCHVAMARKDAFISTELQLQNHSLIFIHKKIFSFSNQRSISFIHGLTLLLPWTISLVPTVWTLAIAKTDLDDFLGPNMIPTTRT